MTNVWMNSKKKYILYVIICLAYLSDGIDIALVGPAVKDLAALMGQKKEDHVLFGFTIRSFANGVGSLIACYTCNKFNRQLQYTASIFIYGVGTVLLPYLNNIYQYLVLSFFFGFCNAYIDLSTNLFVLELFANYHLSIHVQTVHFSLAIGQTLGPLMLGPFLAASQSDKLKNASDLFLEFDDSNVLNETILHEKIARTTNIFVPFTFGGSLFVACSVAMFVCWIWKPYIQPKRLIEGKDVDLTRIELKEEILIPSRSFYILFVILVLCLNLAETVMEYSFLYFISIYLANYLKIEGTQNTNLIALVGIFYIIGRGLNVAISLFKMPVTIMLYVNICLLLIGSTLIFYITPSTGSLSILTVISLALIGLGYSSSLPGMYIFIENRINITTTLNCFMIATSTAAFCLESYRMSSKIHSDPENFKNMNLFYTIAFAISFVLLHSTDFIKKKFLTVKKVESVLKSKFSQEPWEFENTKTILTTKTTRRRLL